MTVKELFEHFNIYFNSIRHYDRHTKETVIFENQESNITTALLVTNSFIAVHGDEQVADWHFNIDGEDSLEILIEVEE